MKNESSSIKWKEEGQATIMVVLALSMFLLVFLGFAVDETNLFFHRQMAQGVADSACVAGIADMYKNQVSGTTLGGFTAGQDFDCAGTPAAAPCAYARINGYQSAGLGGPGTNLVKVTFPKSVPGVVTPPAAVAGDHPFIMAEVTDRVQTFFVSLATGKSTQDVRAIAKCALQVSQAPVPILVLDPTEQNSFSTVGDPKIHIVGGPTRSIQVNSLNMNGVRTPWGNAKVDLTLGGPEFNGSDFGVSGGPTTAPSGFLTTPPATWEQALPVQDPFIGVLAPTDPGVPGQTFTTSVDGCPVAQCTEYTAGDYPAGILIQNQVALFQPGVYYVGKTFEAHANSLLRPSTAAGDGSKGTIFVLEPGASVYIGSNSGGVTGTSFDTSLAHCPGDQPYPVQLNIPATVDGNVLLAPCTKDGTYPQAPQGKGIGPDRGILFWQDRSAQASETMNGGGGLLLVGTMYFHQCQNSTTTGCLQPPTEYQTTLTLVGNSGSNTKVLGEIVTDQLVLKGSSTITMDLNPFSINLLKMALVQ